MSDGGDLVGEPCAGYFDAFERVSAVDVPCYFFFSPYFASAWPADVLQAANEGGGKRVCGIVGAEEEVLPRDGDGEAGVCLLEIGC